MLKVRSGKRHARFEPGHATGPVLAGAFRLALRLGVIRRVIWRLPMSRLRTSIIARYARFVWETIAAGDADTVLPAIDPAGEWRIFEIETFHGHAGFVDAVAGVVEALGPVGGVLAEEWIDHDRESALLVLRVRAGSTRTGLALAELADQFAFSLRIRDGTVLGAALHASKSDALDAVGLRA